MTEWKETMLETGIDQLLEIVSERKTISASDLSKELSLPIETIETWAEILSKENIISVDYDRYGKLILNNKISNVKEKKKKVEGLRDEVESEISGIEQNVKEESKIMDEEHRSILKFEEVIKKEYGESLTLENKINELNLREEQLKKMLKTIEDEESNVKKDHLAINQIIKNKMKQIKETEENLKSYEAQKDRLFKDIEIIKRLSKAISKEHPADMANKIEEIEKDILEIRKQSRILDKKYSIVRRMISKI
ncbi:MAG: hypothetical protein ABIG84_06065 [archaeon]